MPWSAAVGSTRSAARAKPETGTVRVLTVTRKSPEEAPGRTWQDTENDSPAANLAIPALHVPPPSAQRLPETAVPVLPLAPRGGQPKSDRATGATEVSRRAQGCRC